MISKYIKITTAFITAALLITACSSAPKVSDVVNSRKNKATELTDFGNKYYSAGEYDQALVFFKMALDENIASDYEPGIVKSSNSVGKSYLNLNDNENAEKYFLQALSLSEKNNDAKLRTVSSNNLGELYLRTGDYKNAEKMLDKAFASAETNSSEAAVILHNLGIALKKEGDYSKALSRFSQSAKINLAEKNHAELAANYYMTASVYSKDESYDNAENFLLKALEEDKIVENSFGIGKDFKALGMVNEKKGDIDTAYAYYLKSYMVFDVLKNDNEIRDLLEKLALISSVLGKEKDSAYFYSVLEKYTVKEKSNTNE